MADTRVQSEVEDWVRREWMATTLGQRFSKERVKLRSGGVFEFDAVSNDFQVIATISTSSGNTSSGKRGVGKFMKIRSDMYFLLLAPAGRRLVILTEPDMHQACCAEKDSGRVPEEIEFILAEIPPDLRHRLEAAKRVASEEVRPR
jgi:hypothetical protein